MKWYEGPFGSIKAWAYCNKTKAFHPSNTTIKRLNDKHQMEEIHLDVNTVQLHIQSQHNGLWMNAYAYTDMCASPTISNSSDSLTSIKLLGPMCLLAPRMNDLIVDLANCESDSKELADFIREARVICSEGMRMQKAMGGE